MTDRPRIPEELRRAHTENVAAVLVFLLYSRRQYGPNFVMGGRTVQEALEAFGRLAGIDIDAADEKICG